MDNVITLIVILIVVWSMVSKYKAKRKKQSSAKPAPGGWITTLKTFIADIQRQIEEQTKNRTGDTSGWDRFLDDSQTESDSTDAEEVILDDRVLTKAQNQPLHQKIPPAGPLRVKTSQAEQTQVDPGALHVGKPSRVFTVASRADLRNAVIWSEIIGPPIALRD